MLRIDGGSETEKKLFLPDGRNFGALRARQLMTFAIIREFREWPVKTLAVAKRPGVRRPSLVITHIFLCDELGQMIAPAIGSTPTVLKSFSPALANSIGLRWVMSQMGSSTQNGLDQIGN